MRPRFALSHSFNHTKLIGYLYGLRYESIFVALLCVVLYLAAGASPSHSHVAAASLQPSAGVSRQASSSTLGYRARCTGTRRTSA